MWRLGYYRGVTGKMWNKVHMHCNGPKAPCWQWTNIIFPENYTILDYGREVLQYIPHGYVWAICWYEPRGSYVITEEAA